MRAPVHHPAEHPEPTEPQPEIRMTRRERRAAARGATPTGKIPIKAGAKLPPPPVRHRDYITRKGG